MKNQRALLTDGVGFMSSNPTEEPTRYVYSIHAGADARVLMTVHREFRELDLRRAKEQMRTPIVIDGRRVFEKYEVRGLGFVYEGGRGLQYKRV